MASKPRGLPEVSAVLNWWANISFAGDPAVENLSIYCVEGAGLPMVARSYLLGEGLGQDGHQVLQRSLGVEFAGVLWGATLLRGLAGGDGVRASRWIGSECRRGGRG